MSATFCHFDRYIKFVENVTAEAFCYLYSLLKIIHSKNVDLANGWITKFVKTMVLILFIVIIKRILDDFALLVS